MNAEALIADGQAWLWVVGMLAGATLAGLIVHFIFFRVFETLAHRVPAIKVLDGHLIERAKAPTRLLFPVLMIYAVRPYVRATLTDNFPEELATNVITIIGGADTEGGILHFFLVFAVAWLAIATIYAIEQTITERFALDQADNLRARKVITQARILRRIAIIGIGILAVGVILLQYQQFRDLGAGLLASAGIVGIIFGVAAQRTLGNVIAGFQIAFTQPIRVDDVVVVEGDFGWVEEITLTYVVVRVWDQRRIVLPITYFIEKPFQNWTRKSSDLLGTVYLYVDHAAPIDAIREELKRICEASEHWDGRVWRLHVTNTSEKTVELRALASAASAPVLWELRCEIREKLVTFMRDTYPESVPALRARLQEPGRLPAFSGDGGQPKQEPIEESAGSQTPVEEAAPEGESQDEEQAGPERGG